MYLAFKNLKKNPVNNVTSKLKSKKQVRIMFLEFEVQETMYVWCL